MLKYGFEELDYFRLCREFKSIKPDASKKKIKVALLADFASQQLTVVLKTLFFKSGFNADILEAEFDSIDHSIYSGDSGLEAFAPELVLILESTQVLRAKYYASKENTASFADEWVSQAEARWDHLKQKCPAAVILQSSFVLPYEKPFGNYGNRVAGTFSAVAGNLNSKLAALSASRRDVLIVDVDSIASFVGKKSWSDERLWALYKYPCALEYFPLIAQALVDIALALKGIAVKCVIVDLDNTIWGGVIGDDGLEGIKLGHGDEGENFLLFQNFLLELKRRGILLAVCSKNESENARLPFQKHPEMILHEDDFAVFVANWDEKPKNIRLIQETLNIGFDSMVFLDDSAFERNFVRQILPEVIVPELPEDPANYVKYLSELNLFETASYSEADSSRTRMYQQEMERKLTKSKFENYDDYLKSLDMKITLNHFALIDLARSAQLLQRSNQFNLATRRYSEAQCEAFMKDEDSYLPVCVSLRDRFGDYGLISCVIVSWKGAEALIDEWVMSCRVLFRGVEQCTMNHIFNIAKQKGITRVVGYYIPSDKNKMVQDFYGKFGFKLKERSPEGVCRWAAAVADYEPKTVLMEVQGSFAPENPAYSRKG